jgi:hypothetical protein
VAPAGARAKLQRVMHEIQDKSRAETASGEICDIGPGHAVGSPVLRRVKSLDIQHEAYWSFSTGLMADVAADLVGPNVIFYHSKLNFKWFDASDTVKWHQEGLLPGGVESCAKQSSRSFSMQRRSRRSPKWPKLSFASMTAMRGGLN